MPTLKLTYENDTLDIYNIKEGEILKIGRSDQNDIVLDESAVSGFHAEIEFDSDAYYITDIQSKNGTFVDGELVISRKLKHNNVISIGSYSLLFQYGENENRPEESETAITDATMMLDTSVHRSKLAKSLSEVGEYKKQPHPKAELIFLDDSREPLLLDKPVTTIGKAEGCDITIKGLFVPRTAAEIYKKNDVFYIKPITEKTYPKINYRPAKTESKLSDFDVIEIGSAKMQFHYRIS